MTRQTVTMLAAAAAFGVLASEGTAKPVNMPPPRIAPIFNQAASGAGPRVSPARTVQRAPRSQGMRLGQNFNNKAGQTSRASTAQPRRTAGTPATPNPRVWTGWLSSLKARLLPSRGSGTPSSAPAFNGAAASSLTLSFQKAAQGPMVTRQANAQPGPHLVPRP